VKGACIAAAMGTGGMLITVFCRLLCHWSL